MSNDTGGDYVAKTMRTIHALQKQMQDLGARYQDELTHPHAAGAGEQELLRDITRQIQGVKLQIEALQNAIIERQATDALRHKSEKPQPVARSPGKAVGSSDSVSGRAAVTVPDAATGAAATASADANRPVDPTRTVGVLVDTTA